MSKRSFFWIIFPFFFLYNFSVQSQPKNKTTEIKAFRAADFLNSLGVVSSVSRRGETLGGTVNCIEYTGIKWIRAGYESGIPVEDLIELNRKTGVKYSYGLLSGGNDIPRLISGAKQLAQAGALIAIEGPNEPNNWGIKYKGETGGGNKSWLPVAKLQSDLYKTVKNDSLLKNIPVWSLSENGAQTDNTGLQFLTIPENANTLMPVGTKYADFANCHNYICHPSWPGLHNNQAWLSSGTGKEVPVDGLYGNYGKTWRNKFQGYSDEELINLPRVTTETGIAIGNSEAITEEIQGCLFLDLYLSQFKRGWKNTAIYLLKGRADEPAHESYAFYKLDYTPKKAAVYLHNFTTVLSDDDLKFAPGNLNYSMQTDSETVHDLLLQKNNGTFYLVIWGERFIGNEDQVTINFGKKHKLINVYDPTVGSEKLTTYKNKNTITFSVSNHPIILELL